MRNGDRNPELVLNYSLHSSPVCNDDDDLFAAFKKDL